MTESPDTDVLIIGAGASGIGLAVQLQRKLSNQNYVIVDKGTDVGGTWLQNTYPGCGCDVKSHFYSYSFAPNPDWTRAFSLQPEIQSYFRRVAEQYDVISHVRFRSAVQSASWRSEPSKQYWEVQILDEETKRSYVITARALVSGVGSLSIPKDCTIPGHGDFRGKLFHSARWDMNFDWSNKDVVVIGNGCSATQFVPVIASSGPQHIAGSGPVKKVTQFSRQAHYLAARENPAYSNSFKAIMRHVPLASRMYRAKINLELEMDFAGFYTETGQKIRHDLAKENEQYVRKMAPPRYAKHLIPRHEIGCKRKVLDTDYLKTLHQDNVELIPDDPVDRITEDGVVTKSGRTIHADAIVLATGFQTHKLLAPMEIRGEAGTTLSEHWERTSQGTPSAYMGTLVPGFPNFMIMMGPNTLTGHMSVIYTTESQILLTLGLLAPMLSSHASPLALPFSPLRSRARPTTVAVTPEAAIRDIKTTHEKLKNFVWASGCTSWALDPTTGRNVAMYPGLQTEYWLRCLFLRRGDFIYSFPRDERKQLTPHAAKLIVGFGWKYLRRVVVAMLLTVAAIVWRKALRSRVQQFRATLLGQARRLRDSS